MVDKFETYLDTPWQPVDETFLITPHDVTAIDPVPKAVRFNGAGDVTYRALKSTADVTETADAGTILPVRMEFIRVALTTVTGNIIGYA